MGYLGIIIHSVVKEIAPTMKIQIKQIIHNFLINVTVIYTIFGISIFNNVDWIVG
jgi:hypothetical protein